MCQRFGRLVTAFILVLGGTALGDDDASFAPLFNGQSLEGWTCDHTDRYSARDGVIVNNGGTGWLRYNKPFKDFELRAEYRAMRKGADSGVFFRASAESTPKEPHWPVKGYQLQVIDARNHCAIFGHGVAPPKFNRRTYVLKEVMEVPKEWQTITLKVVGTHAEVALNGKTITVSDTIVRPEGCIGLQGEDGYFEWRNLKIKELPARGE
jgi:hypothetical protein